MGLLSVITFLPILGAILILAIPSKIKQAYRYIALGITGIQLALTLFLVFSFNYQQAGINKLSAYQFVERVNWITFSVKGYGTLNIQYFMGVDGLSITMVLLSAIIYFIGVFASWSIEKNEKGYYSLYLLLNTATFGVFCALDFFLFYVFWEVMLLPLYFLISIWGGPRREYAAMKFFLYTLLGSVFMLLVMIGLYTSVVTNPEEVAKKGMSVAQHSFSMIDMMNPKNYVSSSVFAIGGKMFGINARILAFAVLFIAFAIKVPMAPLHTWLPDAHVEAPTPISAILAGILLKLGGYAILRICYGIFPEGGIFFQKTLMILGAFAIIYGAFCAAGQKDLKKLIAYSSVSHMGYVTMGIAALTPLAVNGAIFQMFNHGIISSLLFILVGVIYDRVHDRQIASFRGLFAEMPVYGGFVIFAFMASLGLPMISGFVSESMVFIGSFETNKVITMIATSGVLLTAIYYLWTLQRMFFGPLYLRVPSWKNELKPMTASEYASVIPLVVIAIWFGIQPSACLDLMSSAVNDFIAYSTVKGKECLEGFEKLQALIEK
ncbi:MAG: NADH-quinone oxidoreductase subunit M [Bacteroidia bacterium]|nr:NADH-quinone oxidoreductase subunit M [Bacteroidia bacterium]